MDQRARDAQGEHAAAAGHGRRRPFPAAPVGGICLGDAGGPCCCVRQNDGSATAAARPGGHDRCRGIGRPPPTGARAHQRLPRHYRPRGAAPAAALAGAGCGGACLQHAAGQLPPQGIHLRQARWARACRWRRVHRLEQHQSPGLAGRARMELSGGLPRQSGLPRGARALRGAVCAPEHGAAVRRLDRRLRTPAPAAIARGRAGQPRTGSAARAHSRPARSTRRAGCHARRRLPARPRRAGHGPWQDLAIGLRCRSRRCPTHSVRRASGGDPRPGCGDLRPHPGRQARWLLHGAQP